MQIDDKIKVQMLDYDCNDIKCLICGEKPKDSGAWEIIHESFSVRYECRCGLFCVYYGFHKTTNEMADYDISNPTCPVCGASNICIKEEFVLGGDLEIAVGCCGCECQWMEFYKYCGVNLYVRGGLLSSNIHNNEVLFLPLPHAKSTINEQLNKYVKIKIIEPSGDNLL